ncbi:MAG: hypothetical protein AAFR38_01075 [Planctomycetota bacterium]
MPTRTRTASTAAVALATLASLAAAQPSNDDCRNALALTPGVATQFSTAGATRDGSACSALGRDTLDVWFSFTNGQCPQTATFRLNSFDGTIAAFPSCGGRLIVCSQGQDLLGNPSIQVSLAANQTVLLRVAASNNGIDAGSIIAPSDTIDSDFDGVVDCLDTCPGPNVLNQTTGVAYPTLDAAENAANAGDVLILGPCVFEEDDLRIENSVTIRGQGPGSTIIRPDGTPERIMWIFGSAAPTVIEGLTIADGLGSGTTQGWGGVLVFPSQPGSSIIPANATFRDVVFEGHDGNGGEAGAAIVSNSFALFERCIFRNNGNAPSNFGAADIKVKQGGIARIVNSLFHDPVAPFDAPIVSDDQNTSLTIVNTTLVGPASVPVAVGPDARLVGIRNSVLAEYSTPDLNALSNVAYNLSVFANAAGNNIDAAPAFIDRPGGDFRLAPGSAGIDAADFAQILAVSDGLTDVSGGDRSVDQPGTPDTGFGLFTFLDMGAFETPVQASPGCSPADVAAPFGVVSQSDVAEFVNLFFQGCPTR